MNNVKVGKFIKEQLKKQKITQEQLAEKLGISSPAISQALSGKNSFDISNLMEISKILDIDLDSICNAGEERETHLERLAKMSVENYLKEDPKFSMLRETDSKGLKMSDYLLKHKNVDLISKLMNEGLKNQYKDNIEFLALAVNYHKSFGLDMTYFINENRLPRFITDSRSQRKQRITERLHKSYVSSNVISEFDELNEEEKMFVHAILDCEDQELLSALPYFKKGIADKNIPNFVYFAIQFDKLNILEFEEDVHAPYDPEFRQLLQRKYKQLLIYAIKHKSKASILYFYHKLKTFKFEDMFNEIFETNDLEFVKWCHENLTNKGYDRFYQKQATRFENSKTLKSIVKNDNLELLRFAIEFSSNEALNKALKGIPEDKIEFILTLVKAGANFTYSDGYNSSTDHELVELSAVVRYLLKH